MFSFLFKIIIIIIIIIIINDSKSRMTVGKMIELIAGKAGALTGHFRYGSARRTLKETLNYVSLSSLMLMTIVVVVFSSSFVCVLFLVLPLERRLGAVA